MTFQELFDSLDLTKLEPASYHVGVFEDALSTGTYFGWSSDFGQRVQVIPVNTWICTDTEVGLYVFFMDMQPVAVSYQSARRNDTSVYWLDEEAPNKMWEFIRSLEKEPSYIKLSLTEDVPALWLVEGGSW